MIPPQPLAERVRNCKIFIDTFAVQLIFLTHIFTPIYSTYIFLSRATEGLAL